MRVKWLSQELNAMTPARASLEPLDLEMSTLTVTLLCLPLSKHSSNKFGSETLPVDLFLKRPPDLLGKQIII